ncbi:hypothetical protein ACFLQO_00740 [Candidatus Aenigmatarchaeota archaeon]
MSTRQTKIAIAGVIGILVVFFVSLSFMGGLYSDVSSVTLGEMSGDDVAMISGAVIDTGERKCTDNDGGLNYHKKGQTTDGMITREDICLNDGLTLKEFFCMDELVSSVRNDCTAEGRVCLNGICAEEPASGTAGIVTGGVGCPVEGTTCLDGKTECCVENNQFAKNPACCEDGAIHIDCSGYGVLMCKSPSVSVCCKWLVIGDDDGEVKNECKCIEREPTSTYKCGDGVGDIQCKKTQLLWTTSYDHDPKTDECDNYCHEKYYKQECATNLKYCPEDSGGDDNGDNKDVCHETCEDLCGNQMICNEMKNCGPCLPDYECHGNYDCGNEVCTNGFCMPCSSDGQCGDSNLICEFGECISGNVDIDVTFTGDECAWWDLWCKLTTPWA